MGVNSANYRGRVVLSLPSVQSVTSVFCIIHPLLFLCKLSPHRVRLVWPYKGDESRTHALFLLHSAHREFTLRLQKKMMDGKGWQIGESESTAPRVSFVWRRLKRLKEIGLRHAPPARLHVSDTKVLGRCWLDSASWIYSQAWLEHFLLPQQSQRANGFCISSDGGTVSVLI